MRIRRSIEQREIAYRGYPIDKKSVTGTAFLAPTAGKARATIDCGATSTAGTWRLHVFTPAGDSRYQIRGAKSGCYESDAGNVLPENTAHFGS